MNKTLIGIIGEFNHNSISQAAINSSLDELRKLFNFDYKWIDTETAVNTSEISGLSGIWSASGSPFKNIDGALNAIKYARINNIPHLGTCGGFQHTVIEFVKNILNISNADHEEYNPGSSFPVITKMLCLLAGTKSKTIIKENTLAYSCYNCTESVEEFYCSYGINPLFVSQISDSYMIISGVDCNNDIRIIELPNHPFFIATLFVPQTKILAEEVHPLITNFIEKCISNS